MLMVFMAARRLDIPSLALSLLRLKAFEHVLLVLKLHHAVFISSQSDKSISIKLSWLINLEDNLILSFVQAETY
jgi:hypothetical protein